MQLVAFVLLISDPDGVQRFPSLSLSHFLSALPVSRLSFSTVCGPRGRSYKPVAACARGVGSVENPLRGESTPSWFALCPNRAWLNFALPREPQATTDRLWVAFRHSELGCQLAASWLPVGCQLAASWLALVVSWPSGHCTPSTH